MAPDDEIPGWTGARAGDRRGLPDEPNIPARLGSIWQVCKARPKPIFGLAVLIQGVAGLLAAPLLVSQLQSVGQVLGSSDPGGVNAALAAAQGLHEPLIVIGTIASLNLSYGSILLLIAALAVLVLSKRDNEDTIRGALRAVAGHAMDLLLLLSAAVFGATVFVSLEAALDSSSATLAATAADSTDGLGQAFGIELLVFIAFGIVVYAGVRWAMALPAMVLERIGIRAALSRSSELTRGRRLSVALTLLVVGLIEGIPIAVLTFGFVWLVGPGHGLDAGSVLATLAILVAWIAIAPFLPLAIVVMYRDFSAAGPRPLR
ncbi:MAG: glycerophosphoryl diester phosphodiesterase membrane domain-containing protein [Candidatus Limnocylindrales bacterium]